MLTQLNCFVCSQSVAFCFFTVYKFPGSSSTTASISKHQRSTQWLATLSRMHGWQCRTSDLSATLFRFVLKYSRAAETGGNPAVAFSAFQRWTLCILSKPVSTGADWTSQDVKEIWIDNLSQWVSKWMSHKWWRSAVELSEWTVIQDFEQQSGSVKKKKNLVLLAQAPYSAP